MLLNLPQRPSYFLLRPKLASGNDGSRAHETLQLFCQFACYFFAFLSFFCFLQAASGSAAMSIFYGSVLSSTTCVVAAVHYYFIAKKLSGCECRAEAYRAANHIRYRDWAISLIPMTLDLQMLAQKNVASGGQREALDSSEYHLALFLLATLGQPLMVVLGTMLYERPSGRGQSVCTKWLASYAVSCLLFGATAGLTVARALSAEGDYAAEKVAVVASYALQCLYPLYMLITVACYADWVDSLFENAVFTALDILSKAGLAFFTLWIYQYDILN